MRIRFGDGTFFTQMSNRAALTKFHGGHGIRDALLFPKNFEFVPGTEVADLNNAHNDFDITLTYTYVFRMNPITW